MKYSLHRSISRLSRGHFEPLCKRVNMRSKTKSSKVYCVGVRLAA